MRVLAATPYTFHPAHKCHSQTTQQAAVGPPVFELLRRRLSVGFECFASPLNAAYERCASAFPDVDGPFGSCGSFFK